jgi:CHAD domain-containing protein
MMATHFELPVNLTPEALIATLSDKLEFHLVSRQQVLKTYYDSFDWRLYEHGLICEFNQSTHTSALQLSYRKNGERIARMPLFEVPAFSKQFNPGKVRQILEPLLEMRALLAVGSLECEAYHLNIVNADEKIVLRILIEEFELINTRLTLFPIKGYDKVAERIAEMVTKELGLYAVDKPLLLDALKLQGRHPKDYSSKLDIPLVPKMRADIASKTIFSYLLQSIKANEQGTITNTDSEFLHDFRVAVRRTRAGLSQLKSVLPEDIIARYKEFFSWLGQITGETRDLDAYLLNFEHYKKQLPSDLRQSINPLHHFLALKQRQAQKQLAKKLHSSKYSTLMAEWEAYLASPLPKNPTSAESILTIKELADQRIWKIYKQSIKEGDAIDRHSPPEALHKLRKTCKKLRYLMEFFRNLYPEHRMDKLLKRLKRLQDVLGDYQDYATQQEKLKQFSEQMQGINTPSKTFLAMEVLIQDFDSRKNKVRDHFTWQFAAFKKTENHTAFHALFAPHNV